MITILYTSIDRVYKRRKFKTLKGARKFAMDWVGPQDVEGGSYAVSDDGVGKVTWIGVTRRELFGDGSPSREDIEAAQDDAMNAELSEQAAYERQWVESEAEKIAALERPYRAAGCTCSDQQLNLVGCNCAASEPWDTDGDTSRWNENGEAGEAANDRNASKANPGDNGPADDDEIPF